MFGSLCARDYRKKNIRRNHREGVVDNTDHRVELSCHTLFFLPAFLVPSDNSDHDHVLLSVSLVHPPML